MKSPSLIAVAFLTLAFAGLAYAEPPEHAEKIRKEYRGSEAPDHLMFMTLMMSMEGTAEWNRDIALELIQKHMHLDSEKAAEAFLSEMVAAAAEVESEWEKVWDEMACSSDAPRSKEAVYQTLDRVDDLREIKAHNVYTKFMSTLDESQQEAMTAWLKEEKEGFYYRTAEHKSMYENTGLDVVEHVDMLCATGTAK